jgi:hypothetical protein
MLMHHVTMRSLVTLACLACSVAALAQNGRTFQVLEINGAVLGPVLEVSGGQPSVTMLPNGPDDSGQFLTYRPGRQKPGTMRIRFNSRDNDALCGMISDQLHGHGRPGFFGAVDVFSANGQGVSQTTFTGGQILSFTFPACRVSAAPPRDLMNDPEIRLGTQGVIHRDLAARYLTQPPNHTPNRGAMFIEGVDTSGVLWTAPVDMDFGGASDAKGGALTEIGPISLTVDPANSQSFFDWYAKTYDSAVTGAPILVVTHSGRLLDSVDNPAMALAMKNLWISECYLGDDGVVHVTMRCDSVDLQLPKRA